MGRTVGRRIAGSRDGPDASLSRRIAAAVCGTRGIPGDVVEAAKTLILDAVGAGFASRNEQFARRALAGVGRVSGAEDGTVLGSARGLDPGSAALVNGLLIHGLDFDDTHLAGVVHTSAGVLPAALAAGEIEDRSGGDVLRAFVLGTEVSARVAMAAAGRFHERGFHPTGVKGEPGFEARYRPEKLGYRGIDSAEFVFEDFRVPAGNLLGGEEGRGFTHIMRGLELGRINVAARGLGIARAAFEDAIAYAQRRETFGKPISAHQAIQLKLADMGLRIEAARLLVRNAAEKFDRGERCDLEAGMAKLYASEAGVENSLEAMRIHGGNGYHKDYDVERYFRDAPLMAIGEGTNEIQRLVIAKALLREYAVGPDATTNGAANGKGEA